ncbi:MAG TPA: Flp family type IVb pilin [Rhizomicrobium sp.]|nr:Flp family type IVb pilin [Rhizomicrobium sp.]
MKIWRLRTGVSNTVKPSDRERLIKSFIQDESGATAIEYGLIAGLIALVVIGATGLAGTNLKAKFGLVASKLI